MTNSIDTKKIPKHIAITMDGNGRWAKEKGKSRMFGHNNGVKAVRDTVEGAVEYGIQYLTLFAFSTENWKRPKMEIDALMSLLVSSIHDETKTLIKNNIRLKVIGNILQLPKKCQKKLDECMLLTKDNTRMTLTLALSYSGKWELLNAIKNIIKDKRTEKEISEELFQQYLTTKRS